MWHDRRWAIVGTFGGTLARFDLADGDQLELRTIEAAFTGEWRYSARTAFALTVIAGGASAIVHTFAGTRNIVTKNPANSSMTMLPTSWRL